ncbi:hypothetical protein HG530_011171 [Fusarium avenaceum]|nr:hypothetical protein HG530_011171 [Fusarium avenaceum]
MVLQNGNSATDIGQVGSSNNDDLAILVKTVQFGKQLVQCLFRMSLVSRVTLATYGIKFINEDNRGRLVLGGSKEFTDSLGSNTNEDLVKFTAGHVEERNTSFTSNSSSEERLTGTRRTDQEDTLGKFGTEVAKLFRVLQKLDDFLEFLLGFITTVDIVESSSLLLSLDFRILLAVWSTTTESTECLDCDRNKCKTQIGFRLADSSNVASWLREMPLELPNALRWTENAPRVEIPREEDRIPEEVRENERMKDGDIDTRGWK